MSADTAVMEYFPSLLCATEVREMVDRIKNHFAAHGFGFWAVEEKSGADFIGLIGLAIPRFDAPFTPCVEIGWRLATEHWGKGYAPEGARASLQYAFEQLKLDEVVSFTSVLNLRSQRVMEKIGITRSAADDFEHPMMPDGDRLRPHVLYRISRTDWRESS